MAGIIRGSVDFYRGKSVLSRFVLINAAVFVAVHAVALAAKLSGGVFDVASLLMMPSGMSALLKQPWTPFTYMFTHFGFLHILSNMLWLYCFGVIFLDLYSGRQFVQTYIAGGLAGAAAYVVTGLLSPVGGALVGASAAALAVAAATVVRSPDYRINLFLVGMVKIKWVALAFAAFSLLATDISAVGSHAAHLGGIAAGCAVAFKARFGKVRRRKGVVLAPLHTSPVGTAAELERRLDALLDKVRVSGYNSLSSREKRELNELSEKIKI